MWVVLLNGGAGGAKAAKLDARITQLFAHLGRDVEVRRVHASGIEAAARDAVEDPEIEAVIAGGGDGTVSAVAAAVAGTGVAMGVLPLGTRNNFARDLGLPLSLDAAIRVAADGNAKRVDVGEVNGRVFVNNSSVGLYPDVVRERNRHRWRRRAGKALATLRATWRVLRKVKRRHILLASADRGIIRDAPFAFIGNNDYDPRLLSGRGRPILDGGVLSLWVPRRGASRRILLKLLLRSLVGKLQTSPELERTCLPELWVDLGKPDVRVAADGEVVHMRGPLHYRVRPRALSVFAPAPA